MLNYLKSVYSKTPKILLYVFARLPNHIIFSPHYNNARSQISYDINIIKKKLYSLLVFARDTTEYGSNVIPRNISYDEVFDVFESLPYITADDLSNNLSYYKSNKYGIYNSYFTTTGGTGRKATPVLLSNESYWIEWAYIHSIWEKIGYERNKHTKLTLRGKSVKGDKLFYYNPIYNEVIVDTFRLRRSVFPDVWSGLKNYNIQYIHGYPSLIKEFMEYLKLEHLPFFVRGIMLGSEGISKEDRADMENFFRCKTIAWYGQTEKVILADDVDGNGIYSVFSTYGYPCLYMANEGFGEIAGTTFVNRALPLIKYRTGDYGRLSEESGVLKLSQIRGRWGKDFIYLNKEKRVPTTSINLHSDIQNKILYYQIHQREYGKITITIMPKAQAMYNIESLLKKFDEEMKRNLNGFLISYKIAQNEKDIVKSSRGKVKMLVQEIDSHSIFE